VPPCQGRDRPSAPPTLPRITHRGKIACRRLWQIGLEHSPGEDDGGEDPFYDEGGPDGGPGGGGSGSSPQRGLCNWLRGSTDPQLVRGSTGLWVNVFDASSPQPGRVLLGVARLQRELPPGAAPACAGMRDDAGGQSKGSLKVSSCQAYDYILLAALKSQVGLVWWWQWGDSLMP
jgi:hypothetical protein